MGDRYEASDLGSVLGDQPSGMWSWPVEPQLWEGPLYRSCEDCRQDLMAAHNRLSKLLLRRGIVYYGGTPIR
ncbi:hypothetical protein MGALJ_61690 (plasmid) [Mycobacterium gallinarum]|uniref:Uncharacterized protein n=1 Tax=Mycobacterium gallinarum TaxID=39689 RepID=A0A9W4BEN6_9MYCO|nr:hypothetical protein MGALJ_61690 [Mycobacterium gallinarum]